VPALDAICYKVSFYFLLTEFAFGEIVCGGDRTDAASRRQHSPICCRVALD